MWVPGHAADGGLEPVPGQAEGRQHLLEYARVSITDSELEIRQSMRVHCTSMFQLPSIMYIVVRHNISSKPN